MNSCSVKLLMDYWELAINYSKKMKALNKFRREVALIKCLNALGSHMDVI